MVFMIRFFHISFIIRKVGVCPEVLSRQTIKTRNESFYDQGHDDNSKFVLSESS